MSSYYKDMPENFKNAVDVIKRYCQNEACDYKCSQCPFPLSEIRKRDNRRIGKRPTTRIDYIRNISIDDMADMISKLSFIDIDEDYKKEYYIQWLSEEIDE